ncbi:hypothetical protein Hanom_Chr01g00016541 [Helianthus anomalus]
MILFSFEDLVEVNLGYLYRFGGFVVVAAERDGEIMKKRRG